MKHATAKTGKAVLIIQARMGSTRLPGKSMMPLAGRPLVVRLLERVKRCQRVDSIVLAIPDRREDDVLADQASACGVSCFRGHENDLVDRYYQAALLNRAGIVIRLPADNPVAEPAEIDRLVEFHRSSSFVFSTNLSPVFGSGYPDGIGAEAIDFWALEEVWRKPGDTQKREHPHLNFLHYPSETPANPVRYPAGAPRCPAAYARPDLVLDVNTREQYDYLAALYEALHPSNPTFGIADIIAWHDTTQMSRLTAQS